MFWNEEFDDFNTGHLGIARIALSYKPVQPSELDPDRIFIKKRRVVQISIFASEQARIELISETGVHFGKFFGMWQEVVQKLDALNIGVNAVSTEEGLVLEDRVEQGFVFLIREF